MQKKYKIKPTKKKEEIDTHTIHMAERWRQDCRHW
jgi:hypothetical protein